jgi:hypothetical protein
LTGKFNNAPVIMMTDVPSRFISRPAYPCSTRCLSDLFIE